jgi:hypothetical protein
VANVWGHESVVTFSLPKKLLYIAITSIIKAKSVLEASTATIQVVIFFEIEIHTHRDLCAFYTALIFRIIGITKENGQSTMNRCVAV